MRPHPRVVIIGLLVCLALAGACFGSAYNARPKLVVIVVIDQFRGDYLERYRDQFGEGGFRLLLDHGADFTDCNYNYANTRTGPGHATLLTGAYSNGHGIMANEWWDPQKKRMVTSVQDDRHQDRGHLRQPHRRVAPQPVGGYAGRRTEARDPGEVTSIRNRLKDRAAILAGRIFQQRRLLDRPQDRPMGNVHLLS